MNLNKFAQTQNLHATSLDFFVNDLNIKINPFDSKPIAVSDFFKDEKKVATIAVQNIDKLYVIGLVDDDTLNNKASQLQTVKDATTITQDYPGLVLCAIQLKSTPTRAQLAELTRLVNRAFPYLPVTIIFKYDAKITFANAERAKYLQSWREGEKIGKISMLKDIDLENTHGAHLKILNDLRVSNTIETFTDLYNYWQKILNTKELNKKFFKKIANWYFWSVAKSKFPYEYLKVDAKHKDKTNTELQNLANQKATIRFITRMIFVWFLKEKKLVPSNLFDKDYIKTIIKDFDTKNSSNYYNAILQNLFFATLNRKSDLRDFALDKSFKENQSTYDMNSFFRYENLFLDENPATIMQRFEKIPFINGGLFDCLDIKPDKKENTEAEIIDGFSRKTAWQATMPDELFFENKNVDFDTELRTIYDTKKGTYEVKGLFAIFEEYKFTVEENTPFEVDVALDPYLLGEIFENLLAYYNPETGATARKGSGSFYTPQEIVNYMVDESLLAYLKPFLPNLENFQNLQDISANEKSQLVKALAEVKILDPACGSGAFPMGVLYKMVDILKTIDPNNSIWKQVQHDKIIGDEIKKLANDAAIIENLSDHEVREKAKKAVADKLLELENNFNNNYHFDDYTRKLYIIRNSIYGVDIQDVAIQISKLRFFLSLIIDQKNENIEPLPNLETKFVIANTLIGIELPKSTIMGEEDHSQDQVKQLKEELKTIREQHFYVTDRKQKDKLKKQDKAKREEIAKALGNVANTRNLFEIEEQQKQIEKLKIDLIKADTLPEKAEIDAGNLFEPKKEITYPRKNKISEVTRSIKNCESKITSLQTSTQADTIEQQALKIAQWDIYNQNAQAEWFDMDWMFGITDGFDIVIGNPPYVVFEAKMKEQIEPILKFEIYNKCKGGKLNAFELFLAKTDEILKNNGICCQIFQNSFLADNSSIGIRKHYLDKNQILLIDSFPERDDPNKRVFESVKMSVCILISKKTFETDYNFALNFHRNKSMSDFDSVMYSKTEVIKMDNQNYVFPSLLEKDKKVFIKYYENKNKYSELFECIEGELNMTFHKSYMTNNIKFPKIIKGAQVQRYFITNKPSQGIIEYVDKNKYIKDYSKSKKSSHYKNERIALQGITGANDKIRIVSSYLEEDLFCANSCNYIISKFENSQIRLKSILGIFNSKLTNWIFRKTSTNSNVNCYEINNLILPLELTTANIYIEPIVDQILEGKKQGNITTALEHQIDVMVYHLYGLSYEEALVIDGSLSKEDYDKYVIARYEAIS